MSGGTELGRFLPAFDVSSRHQTVVRATPAATFTALLASDFSSSPLVRALMRLRGYGRRPLQRAASLAEALRRGGFVELAVVPGEEVVFGLAGRFWRPGGDLVPLASPAEFLAFERSGYAKTAWNFSLQATDGGHTLLRTETRIRCFGTSARRRFRAYWFLVAPFSGLIRRELLRVVRRRAEAGALESP